MKGVCMKKLKHHLGCALAGLLLGTLLFLNCLSPVSASSISWDTAVKNGSNVYLSYYYLMKDGLYDYTMNNYESAYIKEVTKRENSTAFQTLLTSYRIATFSLSEGVSFTNKETGFYEALIFDMLYDDSTESIFSTLVDSSVDAATDVNTQAAALTATVSKELLDLNIDIIKNIPFDLSTDDGMSQLLENLKKCEALSDFMEHIGKAEKFTGHFKTALEFVQRLCQVKTVYNAGYYQKQIIDDLYLDASMSLNPAMKTALKKYSEILNQNLSEIDITAILLGDTATQKIAESLSKKISKGLWAVLGGELGTLYGTAISTGQSVGKFTSDTLFNTSESVSSYYKLRASVQMELLLKKRVKSYENIVCQYPTSENARKFNDSVQMLNKIYVSGLDSFEEFIKKTYQEGTINEIIGNCNALLGGNKETVYKEFLKHLDGIRSTLKLSIHTDEMRAYRTYEDILKDLAEENKTTDVTTASGLEVKDIDSILPDDKKPDVVLPKLRSDSTSMYGSLSKDKTLQADSEEWGSFALTDGTLNVNGFNMTIYGDLNMSGGTIDLNGGTLTVTGNINQSGGTITVNGGTLNTGQNYQLYTETTNEETGKTTLSYGGTLEMGKAKSVVNVSGDYTTYAYSARGDALTSGTLNISGNFKHLGYGAYDFSPNDNLEINFLKNGITEIFFANTEAHFNANTHFKSQKIKINTPFCGWKLAGNVTAVSDISSFSNTMNLNGYSFTVNGNLNQPTGTMYINGGTLNVTGNYLLYKEMENPTTHIVNKSYGGSLSMDNKKDVVNIEGNYETYAYSARSDVLTAGTLNISGNFIHLGCGAYDFSPDDNLEINFLKNGITEISFANTEAHFNANTHFKSQKIKINTPFCGWKLAGNVTAVSDISSFSNTMNLNGYSFTVNGNLNQPTGSMYINDGTLNVNGNYLLYKETENSTTHDKTKSYGGSLGMDKNSVVNVQGNYETYAYSARSDTLSSGTLNISGNFIHLGYGAYDFSPDDNLEINFLKNGTTEISFANTEAHFNANTHFKSGQIKINTPFHGWKLNDNLSITSTLPKFTNTLNLNGYSLTINGNLNQPNGTMYVNGGILNVNGNYLLYRETEDDTTQIKTKSSGGSLYMDNKKDLVNIQGNYETYAYSARGDALTAGTLNISGNFKHLGYGAYDFSPDDNLEINFLKDGITEVSFANTSAHFNSNTHFKSGKLKLSGKPSGWTLHQDLTFSDTLPAFSGTFDLNGYTMNISDDLNQPSGTIKVNGGTLNISGNYNLYGTKTNEVSDLEEYISGGTLITSKAADVVNIGKDFVAYGDESSSSLQYGTININGDLTHLGYNFAPSNNVTLNFKKVGTTTLNFASTAGHLNTNSHFSSGNVMILGKPMGWTLNEDITIYGDMPAFTGTFDLNGHGLTFEKSLTQPTGSIKVNRGTLHMKGDYNLHSTKIDDVTDEKTLASGGSFLMQNVKDKVTIDGNFTVYSSNGSDYLKAGTLTLKGNLKQEGGSYSFYPTYLHKTILAGNATPDKKQKVSFTNSNCKFYFLELTKPRDRYEFNPDNCWHDIKQVEKTDLSSAKVTLSKEEYIYQKGKSVEPEVTVVLDKDTLTNGTDYTVTFSDNGKPGTGKLTIEGINLYKGTIEKTFTITCKHTFSEWKIVKEPSTTEKGRKERICSICNTKESADLDKSNIQEVPDGTTRLDQNSFKGNTSITEVTLPDSLEIIGENTFAGCSKLQKIILPAKVTKIENSAFRNCPELMQIVIQKNVTEIAENAFENSPNVVIYGESGSYAEKYASQHNIPFRLLSEDNIHWKHSGGKATCNKRAVCEICKKEYGKKDASVHTGGTKIVNKKDATTTAEGYTGDTICLGCNATLKKGTIIPKLKKPVTPSKPSKPTKPSAPAKGTVLKTGGIKYTVIVAAKNKTGQVSLSKEKNTASVTVPATIKLNGFTYSVTQIGNSAFAKSSKLKKVIIGKNVSIIGSKAFYQCKNLKTIRIKSTILKKVGAKAFSGTHKKLVIQVPKKQKKAYTKLLKSKGQSKQTKIK